MPENLPTDSCQDDDYRIQMRSFEDDPDVIKSDEIGAEAAGFLVPHADVMLEVDDEFAEVDAGSPFTVPASDESTSGRLPGGSLSRSRKSFRSVSSRLVLSSAAATETIDLEVLLPPTRRLHGVHASREEKLEHCFSYCVTLQFSLIPKIRVPITASCQFPVISSSPPLAVLVCVLHRATARQHSLGRAAAPLPSPHFPLLCSLHPSPCQAPPAPHSAPHLGSCAAGADARAAGAQRQWQVHPPECAGGAGARGGGGRHPALQRAALQQEPEEKVSVEMAMMAVHCQKTCRNMLCSPPRLWLSVSFGSLGSSLKASDHR